MLASKRHSLKTVAGPLITCIPGWCDRNLITTVRAVLSLVCIVMMGMADALPTGEGRGQLSSPYYFWPNHVYWTLSQRKNKYAQSITFEVRFEVFVAVTVRIIEESSATEMEMGSFETSVPIYHTSWARSTDGFHLLVTWNDVVGLKSWSAWNKRHFCRILVKLQEFVPLLLLCPKIKFSKKCLSCKKYKVCWNMTSI